MNKNDHRLNTPTLHKCDPNTSPGIPIPRDWANARSIEPHVAGAGPEMDCKHSKGRRKNISFTTSLRLKSERIIEAGQWIPSTRDHETLQGWGKLVAAWAFSLNHVKSIKCSQCHSKPHDHELKLDHQGLKHDRNERKHSVSCRTVQLHILAYGKVCPQHPPADPQNSSHICECFDEWFHLIHIKYH